MAIIAQNSNASSNPVKTGQTVHVNYQRSHSTSTYLFFFLMVLSITYGWLFHGNLYLSPEEGTGYYLGIIGGILMLILLLYPLRKKVRFLRRLGPMRSWFRIHMVFGVIGPILILYHANFGLGSVNSNVALFSMIIVAASGLIGRFIYTHIHASLYGGKLTINELTKTFEADKKLIVDQLASYPDIIEELGNLKDRAVKRRNFLLQVVWLPIMTFQMFLKRKKIKRMLKKDIRKQKIKKTDIDFIKGSIQSISFYIDTTRKLAQLTTYERLFSLWHILHMPLFIMLVVTGIIHVIAVHMY